MIIIWIISRKTSSRKYKLNLIKQAARNSNIFYIKFWNYILKNGNFKNGIFRSVTCESQGFQLINYSKAISTFCVVH